MKTVELGRSGRRSRQQLENDNLFGWTVFILLLPFIQAPLTFYKLEGVLPIWGYYVFTATTSLLLVTLSNFQVLLEYPFDPKGMDNVKVREFLLEAEVYAVIPPASSAVPDPPKS